MDLNARIDVNCGRKDGRRDGKPDAKAGATKRDKIDRWNTFGLAC